MLTIHHLNQSRSTRVLWLLEELKVPYQRVDHYRDKQTHLAPDSLKQVHPLGKAPILCHEDITLCESSVILEYILDHAGISSLNLKKDEPQYYDYLYWFHFAESSLSLPVISQVLMKMEHRTGDQPLDGYIAKETELDLSFINNHLKDNDYFVGNKFTAADIMMTVMLDIADTQALLSQYQNILHYLSRVRKREAYITARSFG